MGRRLRFRGMSSDVDVSVLIERSPRLRRCRELTSPEFVENLLINCFTDFSNHYADTFSHHLNEISRIQSEIAARYQRVLNLSPSATSLPADLHPDNLVPLFRELNKHLEALDGNTPTNHLQRQEIPTPEKIDRLIREAREGLGELEPEGNQPLEASEFSSQETSRQTVLFEPGPIIRLDVPVRTVHNYRDIDINEIPSELRAQYESDWENYSGPMRCLGREDYVIRRYVKHGIFDEGIFLPRWVRGRRDIDINEIPSELRAQYESDWEIYTGRMRSLGREAYVRQRYFFDGTDEGIFRRGNPLIEPIFPGLVGTLAERMWSHITGTPQNPGRERGGRFQTPHWGNVEPDFIPAVDRDGNIVFGCEVEYARQNNVPSIENALLVADSKYYGVYRDVPVINFGIFGDHENQVRGMIWLAQKTTSKTFVFLGRPNQQVGRNIQEFATQFGVEVRVTSDPRIR